MHFDLKRKFALGVATAALAVAGCGGDDGSSDPLSKKEYATEVQAILTSFSDKSLSAGAELAGSPDDLRPGVEELQRAAETAVDDLRSIQPPEAAVDGHQALTDAMDGYLADVGTFSNILEGGDEAEAEQAGLDYQQAGMEFQEEFAAAVEQLKEAGIEPPSG